LRLSAGTSFQAVYFLSALTPLTRRLLVYFAPGAYKLLRQFEVAIAGSVSAIEVLLKNLPPVGRWFSMVGLFDGDVRSTTQLKEARWPWVFLPGEVSPEELLQNHLGALPDAAERLANMMHSSQALISLALNNAIGKDHHDYFSAAAQNLGCEVSAMRRAGRPGLAPG
jgi:hypothetical protein